MRRTFSGRRPTPSRGLWSLSRESEGCARGAAGHEPDEPIPIRIRQTKSRQEVNR